MPLGCWCICLLGSCASCLIQSCHKVTMNYVQYDPKVHTLEIGTKIKLAGREGSISGIYNQPAEVYMVYWQPEAYIQETPVEVDEFPDLLIAIEPPKIDKRVKEEIRAIIMKDSDGVTNAAVSRIMGYLNSLEEV